MEQLNFTLPDFTNDDKFPIEYTGRGKDLSPEIIIENLSEKAKTLAVTLEDISHPYKKLYALGHLEYSCGKQNQKSNSQRQTRFGYRSNVRCSIRNAPICRTKTAERQNTYVSHNRLFVRLFNKFICE